MSGYTFEQAMEVAVEEVKDPYAQFYLHCAYQDLDSITKGKNIPYFSGCLEIYLQYCLSNMQYYRGKTAREVKKAFKHKIAELQKIVD